MGEPVRAVDGKVQARRRACCRRRRHSPTATRAKLTLTLPKPAKFTLAIRRPAWAGDGFAVKVNGTPVDVPPLASLRAGAAGGRLMGNEDSLPQAGSFVEISRTWKTATRSSSRCRRPCGSSRHRTTSASPPSCGVRSCWPAISVRVASRVAKARRDNRRPFLVAAERSTSEWVLPGARQGDFQVKQVARSITQPAQAGDVSLTPFYRTHERTYSVYFDVVTPSEFDARVAALAAERERVRRMEAATVAYIRPGDQQAEPNFDYKSDPADRPVARTNGRPSRAGTGWFSYDLAVNPASPTGNRRHVLQRDRPAAGARQFRDRRRRHVDRAIRSESNGDRILRRALRRAGESRAGKIEDHRALPAASGNARIVPIFGVRVVRANEL